MRQTGRSRPLRNDVAVRTPGGARTAQTRRQRGASVKAAPAEQQTHLGHIGQDEASALNDALGGLLRVQETLSLKQSAIASRLLQLSLSPPPQPQPQQHHHHHHYHASPYSTSPALSPRGHTAPPIPTPPSSVTSVPSTPGVPPLGVDVVPSRVRLLADETAGKPKRCVVPRPAWDSSVRKESVAVQGKAAAEVAAEQERVQEVRRLREEMKTPWKSRAAQNVMPVVPHRNKREAKIGMKATISTIDRLLASHSTLPTKVEKVEKVEEQTTPPLTSPPPTTPTTNSTPERSEEPEEGEQRGGAGVESLLSGLASLAPHTFTLLSEVDAVPVVTEIGNTAESLPVPVSVKGVAESRESWGSGSGSGGGNASGTFDPVNRSSTESAFRFVGHKVERVEPEDDTEDEEDETSTAQSLSSSSSSSSSE